MAVRPLRPATDRRLGEPLPHQQANRTRVPLQAPGLAIPDFDHRPSKGGMLCGISHPFGRLSPTRRQVTHALLTRLPLYSQPEGYFRVRLACIRHAASVDSEPGSNSQVKDVASGHSHEWPSDNSNTRASYGSSLFSLCVRLILRRVCFVVLSSFQRADAQPGLPSRCIPPHRSPPSGEPYKVITNSAPVNEDRSHWLFRTYDVNLMTPQQTPPLATLPSQRSSPSRTAH